MKDEIYYVYEWIRLDTNEPFYVGKGKGNRCYELKSGRNKHFINIVKSIQTVVHVLERNLDEKTAFEYEVYYINEYKNMGYCLVNITDGGEGTTLPSTTRKKISKSHIGIRPSEESKNKNRLSHIGKNKGVDNNKSRKIICLNTLEVFNCISESKLKYGKKDIQACCIGNKTYAGKLEDGTRLVWCYYEDYLNMSDEEIQHKINEAKESNKGKNNCNYKPIICITTNKVFNSHSEASECYNIKSKSHITSVCQGKRNYCGKLDDGTKLKWMYYEDYLEKQENNYFQEQCKSA